MSAHDQFKATLGEADEEFRNIVGLEQEISRLIEQHGLDRQVLENPYSPLSGGELNRKWNEVKQLVPRRDEHLSQEQGRQQCKFKRIV